MYKVRLGTQRQGNGLLLMAEIQTGDHRDIQPGTNLQNPTFTIEWQGNGPHWECEGQLWGGNLAMLVSLIGTPWLPQITDGILVLAPVCRP